MPIDEPSPSPLIILHLSDLHFGWDRDINGNNARQLALDALLRTVEGLDPNWRPNCVCVTGDIGWRGSKDDYVQAAVWLEKLLTLLQIEKDGLFFCPGNHDLDRTLAIQNVRPHNSSEADRVLRVPIPKHYEKPFCEFIRFCQDFACPPLLFGDTSNYLIGARSFKGVQFLSLNTAWFSQDDEDKGRLWLGLPLLKHLECANQLPSIELLSKAPVHVAMLHHPKEFLGEPEYRAEDSGRPNTLDYLARRCHLLLTGHTHGEVRKADRIAEGAWSLSGGAAYAGASHFNSFRLIRVEHEKFVYRSFEYDPRSAENIWHAKYEATQLPFSTSHPEVCPSETRRDSPLLAGYRHSSANAALKLIAAKSRALKPDGELPATIAIDVLASVGRVRSHFSDHRELIIQPKNQIRIPLAAAIKKARRTLLLGDLGTGKSTMAATLVGDIQKENEAVLALMIPAKDLRFDDKLTIKDLFEQVSHYFNSQISPASPSLHLETLLDQQWEITLIIDGLDELSRERAAILLSRLGDTVDHWPNIRVLASARPVEMNGVSFSEWNIFSMAPLTDDEKLRFLMEEAKAGGLAETAATDVAHQLVRALRRQPRLNSLANTPLIIRLLYSKLSGDAERPETLGDILTDVIYSRLGNWDINDGKPSLTLFEREFPNARSRASLLGRLALLVTSQDGISLETTHGHLREFVREYSNENPLVLSHEALELFHRAGLISVSDSVRFMFQPLFEVLCGIGLAYLSQKQVEEFPVIESDRWRVMSFFSTQARRNDALESARPILVSFLAQLLTSEQGLPGAAYVVSESQDKQLAHTFVEHVRKLGSHPIRFFFEEQSQSARAIAESLKVAEQIGFDWFYDRYLNPRYPAIRFGSMAVEHVLKQWAIVSLNRLNSREKEMLSRVVRPHIRAGSAYLYSVIPILAFLTPNAFTTEERFWFVGQLLDDADFSLLAKTHLQREFKTNEQMVNEALLQHANRGYENSASAAQLWLNLNAGRPPAIIVRSLIKFIGYLSGHDNVDDAIREVISRIGNVTWRGLLRFYLASSDHYLGAGAAVLLYQAGERSIDVLGTPLLNGIHDGIRARRAEETLNELLPQRDERVLSWLAEKIGSQHDDFMDSGAPSGWWRPFLSRLEHVGSIGPRMLAKAIGGVGCFLFARRPEVRQSLRNLLQGEYGPEYRRILFDSLADLNPKVRHGAAMTLLICEPESQSQALEVVVKYAHQGTSWHEWWQFCLTLSFGPSVLAYIRSRLPLLSADARIFALAVLFRNGSVLTESESSELARGLCDWRNYGLDADDPTLAFISKPQAFPHLLSILEELVSKESEKAAGFLLRHHAERLTLSQLAKCAILEFSKLSPWSLDSLTKQIERLRSDVVYRETVEKVSKEYAERKGKRPTLDLIRESLVDPSGWRKLVWQTICDDSEIKTDNEDAGQWFLDFGREHPEAGKHIGRACSEFLHEHRARRWDARQWLCLLAHEFVELPTADLQSALAADPQSHHSTVSALIARIGVNESGYAARQSVGSMPTEKLATPFISRGDLFEQLLDQTRDSTTVHPKLCDTIERFLYERALSESEASLLLQNGSQGAFAAIGLTVVYELKVAPNAYLNLFPTRSNHQDTCYRQLFELCSLGRRELLDHEETRVTYLTELDSYLATNIGDPLYIAREILAIRGYLTGDQVTKVIDTYATNLTPYDYELGDLLAKWLAGGVQEADVERTTEALRRGVEVLNNYSWERKEFNDVFRFLFFPLAYWKLRFQADATSIGVFLRGLKFLFADRADKREASYALKVIQRLDPLISRVPIELLNEVIESGRESPDPVVHALCRVFSFNRS